jgi:uncharacterized membrane protein YphA (DoxX/SURF4 family)
VRSVSDRRRQLSGFAILALVMMRLVIGWHFFSEGLEKIERDSSTGKYRVNFSAAGFLNQAKGPFAGFFQSLAPNGHDWQTELAVPRQNRPLTAKGTEAARPEQAPYQNWYGRIVADWQAIVDKAIEVPGLTEDQIEAAKTALKTHQQELKNYLESESAAIAEYQHELWRLGEWRAKPEAATVPFQEERIAKKATDTSASAKAWVSSVEELEQRFLADLREILTPEQRTDAKTVAAMDRALSSPGQTRLNWVNLGATALTIGVGTCLLLGLFTRLVSLAGALFLLSIIATQPPWLATAEPTIYQTVELSGLLVLAGTGAGRWLGLDYFSWALFPKHED